LGKRGQFSARAKFNEREDGGRHDNFLGGHDHGIKIPLFAYFNPHFCVNTLASTAKVGWAHPLYTPLSALPPTLLPLPDHNSRSRPPTCHSPLPLPAQGWQFDMAKSIFARTMEKPVITGKNWQKLRQKLTAI